jgi:hypothetical protein
MNSECPQTCHDTQFLIPRVPEKFFFNRWGTGVRYFGSFAGCAKALKKKNILLEEIRVGEGGFFTPIFTPSEVMSPALTKQNGRFHTKPTQTNSCSTYSFISSRIRRHQGSCREGPPSAWLYPVVYLGLLQHAIYVWVFQKILALELILPTGLQACAS